MNEEEYDWYATPALPERENVVKHRIGRFYYFEHTDTITGETVTYGKSRDPKSFTQHQLKRLTSLLPFYTTDRLRSLIVPLISKSSQISLRCVDWLVTNYCETYRVVYRTKQGKIVELRKLYETWLDMYGKRNLDSYRRHWRVLFNCDGQVYSTTPGQLNFLYLCHENDVLNYARSHHEAIDADLNTRQSSKKRARGSGGSGDGSSRSRRKRTAPRSPTYYKMAYTYQSLDNIVLSDDDSSDSSDSSDSDNGDNSKSTSII